VLEPDAGKHLGEKASQGARGAHRRPANGAGTAARQARRRLADSGCLAVMAGRGALIKPWLFQEWATGRAVEPDAADRVGIYRRLVGHMKAHFGDDARGRAKAWYFLPWHFDFFVRYRCGWSLPCPREWNGVWAHELAMWVGRWHQMPWMSSCSCANAGLKLAGQAPASAGSETSSPFHTCRLL
jgi:hypothetical protein